MRFHMRPFTMFLNQVKTLVLQIEKDVRWVGRYTAGHGPDTGKTIYPNVLGRTQAEVREKLKAAIGEAQGLDAAKTGKYTVGQWMDVWYEYYAQIKVRPSSHKTYEGYIKNHIKPSVGNIPLTKLTTLDLQQLYQKLLTEGRVDRLEAQNQPKGLSPKTVRNINQVISSAMQLAIQQHLIPQDPTDGCALPKTEHREMQTLSADQLTAFLLEAKHSGVFEMYYAELAARLRKGELLGLKWEEIDLDRGGLWVKRHGARINGEVAASLKTKNANQTLPPAEDTIQVLKQQRKKTSAVPGCFPHPPAVYLTGQRPAYTPPGAETGGSASGQVPRFTAYIRTAGPPERGRYQDDIRDAGALQRGVHPAYLCPRHHSGPEGGG